MFNHALRAPRAALAFVLTGSLAACGGDNSGQGNPTYAVGGVVSGLAAGASLTLSNNGGDTLTVSTNGGFTFKSSLNNGASYAVAISAAPAQQTCTLTGGTGVVTGAAVSSVMVACTGPYTVGGTVTGLAGGTTVVIANNGTDSLTVGNDGPFTFGVALKPGSSFSVVLSELPAGEQCGLTGASGTVGTANYTAVAVNCATPTLSLVAGALGGYGSADGDRTTARFYYPTDAVTDAAGNVFVADDYNALIRKIDLAGNVTTLAGKAGLQGTDDGQGATARFNNPISIALDPSGNAYVVDAGTNTIRRISPAGVVSTLAGTPLIYGTTDGTGPAASFRNPSSIRWSADESLYLTDNTNIRNITTAGVVTTIYQGLTQIYGLDVSQPGVAFVTDLTAKASVKINLADGSKMTLASGFQNPVGIVAASASSSAAGTFYVSDEFASTFNQISTIGSFSVLAGVANSYGYADGTGAAARFYSPALMSLTSGGNILLADTGANTLRQVTPSGVVTTVAGTPAAPGYVDGAGFAARFDNPGLLVVDSSGNLYVGDSSGLREVSLTGQVTTISSQTGGLSGLARDGNGNFYFTRYPDNSIQRLSPDGTISVVAGSQSAGFSDGTGAAAGFNGPKGVVVDAQGNIFVADLLNYSIRKITPAGVVTTFAGTLLNRGTADGTGAAASFFQPFAMAIDSNGTLFVLDGNAVRMVTSSAVVTTLAGSQTAGSNDGTGAAAQFNQPAGVAIGPNGNIFVSDTGNHTIREISPAGAVTTLAGTAGQAGVKLGPLPATFNLPVGLAYKGSTLYVVDGIENSLLQISGVFQ